MSNPLRVGGCETQLIGLVGPDRIRNTVASGGTVAAQNTIAAKFSTTLEAEGELTELKA
jgi:hypothetical protein